MLRCISNLLFNSFGVLKRLFPSFRLSHQQIVHLKQCCMQWSTGAAQIRFTNLVILHTWGGLLVTSSFPSPFLSPLSFLRLDFLLRLVVHQDQAKSEDMKAPRTSPAHSGKAQLVTSLVVKLFPTEKGSKWNFTVKEHHLCAVYSTDSRRAPSEYIRQHYPQPPFCESEDQWKPFLLS